MLLGFMISILSSVKNKLSTTSYEIETFIIELVVLVTISVSIIITSLILNSLAQGDAPTILNQ